MKIVLTKRISEYVSNLQTKCIKHPRVAQMVLFIFFVFVWLPYYFTYFPGVVCVDEMICIQQAAGDIALSNHHPIIFTLFIKIVMEVIIKLGGTMNTVVAVATFLQICFLAFVLSYCSIFIVERVRKPWCGVFSVLFFAFSPIVAMYSVVLGKDVFFTAWFILYVILIYRICCEGFLTNKMNLIFTMFMFVIVGLARSNGLYVMLLMLPVLICAMKEFRKKIMLCSVVAVLIIVVIKGPIFDVFNVAEPAVAESFSVPIQQVAYTLVKDGNIEQSDLEYLNEILPLEEWKKSYTPGRTSTIKFHPEFKSDYLDETSGKFLAVWGNNLFANFKYYVKAYMDQIRGYWDITHIVNLENTVIVENAYGIVQMDCVEALTEVSLKPLFSFMALVMRKLPIVNILTNQLILAVAYIIIFILLLKTENRRKAITVVPSILIWVTLLIAAPMSSGFRYMLSFHFMIPIMIWLMCNRNEEKKWIKLQY